MAERLPAGSYAFFMQLYVIVNDRALDPIISWSPNSDYSFVVRDVDEFCRRILPEYVEFGRNFSEFLSELRYQGFRRIGRFVFGHENIVRGRSELLKRMIQPTPSNEKFAEKLKAKRDKAKERRARAKVVRLLENLKI